jgi:hypothetical protein
MAESIVGCDSAVSPDGKQFDLACPGAGKLEKTDSNLGHFFVMTPTLPPSNVKGNKYKIKMTKRNRRRKKRKEEN